MTTKPATKKPTRKPATTATSACARCVDLERRVAELEEQMQSALQMLDSSLAWLDDLGHEVRTQRLVVVDETGRERIFTQMTDDRGAALHVQTPGGETVVELVAVDDPSGGPGATFAGMFIFDGDGEAVGEFSATEFIGARGRTAEPQIVLRHQGDFADGYSERGISTDILDMVLHKAGFNVGTKMEAE
ncbi:MAG TPA: hypothetical protein VHD87_08170 [Acidimicrobiales bacterium]|nr:hypothetical protein [Acidimicrobiales bacterium]